MDKSKKNLEHNLRTHYRMLVLDSDKKRAERLEDAFMTPPEDKEGEIGKHPALVRCSKAVVVFAYTQEQLSELPNAAGFNLIWVNVDFPQAISIALQAYSENPFCYVILYGGNPAKVLPFLHARPIGYVRDISSSTEVHQELLHIWSMDTEHDDVIRLRSRNAYYNIAKKSIVFCQSQGRKTYLYVDSAQPEYEHYAEDPFELQIHEERSFFAYEQNIRLDELEQKLNPPQFVRVHQSYLINRQYVSGLITTREGWLLQLTGRCRIVKEIPISERFHERAKSLFE